MDFEGFSDETFDFFEGLAEDNSKEYFHARRAVYHRGIRDPMEALAAALQEEFGDLKVGRPNRDTRFSNDKSPYKTYAGMVSRAQESVGYYLQIGPDGLTAGGGYQVERFRDAVDDDSSGARLDAVVSALDADGYEIVGDTLKTHPRGYSADHPRVHLLRHRSLGAERHHPRSERLCSPEVYDLVREDWRGLADLADLVDWLTRHVRS